MLTLLLKINYSGLISLNTFADLSRIHFSSFDTLRFFAFMKVFLLRIPLDGFFPNFSMIQRGGGIGVSFFFVLSGFLISYLLMQEKLASHRIDLLKFYKRRAFRIWPLYFLLIGIVFMLPFAVKQDYGLHMVGGGYDLDWRYSFTFMENYKMIQMDSFPKTTPLSVFWSLCIEEHFYILWGLIFYYVPIKYVGKVFLGCILLAWFARGIEWSYSSNLYIQTNDLFTNLDYFSFGACLAYFLVLKGRIFTPLSFWSQRNIQVLSLVILLLLLIFQYSYMPRSSMWLFLFRPTWFALVFTLILAFFVCPNRKISMKIPALDYLGQRSFGLYVFHIIAIHMGYQFCLTHHIRIDDTTKLLLFITCAFGISVLVSIISYRFFESPLLRLRERLA